MSYLSLVNALPLFSLLIVPIVYLYKLSNRLQRPLFPIQPAFKLSDDLDLESRYNDIDFLKSIPNSPTSLGYVVIGGSGFLGTCLVRLLLLRGEMNIRIVDVDPPSPDIASNPAVSFVKTDITSLESVRRALGPFKSTGAPPNVIYHTAAIIRFWERFSYCWGASYEINVSGTQNVITAAQELPSAILIYTSTPDIVFRRPRFLRLNWDLDTESSTNIVSDTDGGVPNPRLSESCYSRTKLLAEQLVKQADGLEGLQTGIIRPGRTIIGPNDRLVTSALIMPRVPIFDGEWGATNICVWDAASAHLLLEDALMKRIPEACGQAFLVTGKGEPWRLRDIREAVKYFATKRVILDEIPPLIIFVLAHIMEALLYIRYHALLPFFFFSVAKPRLVPKWLGELVYLQPTALEYMTNVIIDDSRARKILGYRPQWSTIQCIRYAVEAVESGKTDSTHGLKLKSVYDQ